MFGAQPRSLADNDISQPDNTFNNKEDHNPKAENSSNKHGEVKKVAALRRAILAQKGLSINAQNIKIIDRKGTILLRGPVDNQGEKDTIESIVKAQCPAYLNELEVKH
ncbi:unnamed protein product [Sphagnum jensenii]